MRFDCSKLENYATAKAGVIERNKHTIEQVCNSYYLGLLYGLNAIQDFDTIDHDEYDNDGNKHTLYINTDLDFDDESIMLYSSAECMNPDNDANDVMQVLLSFWKHRGVGYEPPEKVTKDDVELIGVNWDPSQGDYEGIMHLCE